MSRKILVAALFLTALLGGCTSDPGEAPAPQASAGSGPRSYERGVATMELGNLRGASAQFEAAIREHPDHLESYWKLGECYLELGVTSQSYLEKAEALYEDLSRRVPEDDRRLLKAKARLLVFQWRTDDALAMYEEVLAREPENCEFWTLYALGQQAKAKELTELESHAEGAAMLDEALISFERATEICPEYFEAYEGIAQILTQRKLYDEVVVIYTDLVKQHPDVSRVVRWYTLAQYRARDWPMAAEAFEELLKIEPTPQDYLNYAAVLRKLERFEDAEEQVRIYEQIAPKLEGPERKTRLDILREELKIVESATRAAELIDEKRFDEAITVWNDARDRVRERLEDPDFEDESRQLLIWLERRIRYAEELKRKDAQ